MVQFIFIDMAKSGRSNLDLDMAQLLPPTQIARYRGPFLNSQVLTRSSKNQKLQDFLKDESEIGQKLGP